MAMTDNNMTDKKIKLPLSLTLEERIAARAGLDHRKVDTVWSQTHEKRKKYFFPEIANHEELWTLWENEALTEYGLSEGRWGVPVWPNKEFVSKFADVSNIENYNIIPIPLDDFMNEIVFSESVPSEIIIFPQKLDHYVEVCDHVAFINQVKNELGRYEPNRWWL